MEKKRIKWSDEEINFLVKNYTELTQQQIANKLNRTVQGVKKKARTLGIRDETPNVNKDDLKEAVNNSYSLKETLEYLGKVISGNAYRYLKQNIRYYDIDTSHFDPHWKSKKRIKNGEIPNETPIEYWLQYGTTISSSKLKDKLYKYGYKERRCELCGQGEEWNGMTISLILDHINGVNNDNRLENLRIVCPNCNAGLPTHCRGTKVKKKAISKKPKKVEKHEEERKRNGGLTDKELEDKKKNRKVERPSYEQLIRDINQLGYLQTGKKYGVSDNAVRKWKKWYETYENVG